MKAITHLKLLLAALAAFVCPSLAHADLQVFPTRVVLSDGEKTAQVSIRHRGEKPMRYRIDAVYYKMLPDGRMEQLKDLKGVADSGIEYFRFSPRQVTLEPNIEQVVRVLLRLPADAKDGEYRAHLYFEGMDEGDEKAVQGTTPTGASMMLKARMAIAVPVIIRKGAPELKVALANLKTVKGAGEQLMYSVDVTREGKANLYGDFLVFHKPTGSDKEALVSQANGVSSYIDKRTVSFPLTVTKLEKGTLRVEVRQPVSDGGKVIASASTDVK